MDNRASQAPSHTLSLHPSTQALVSIEQFGDHTLWVMAKMLGRSITKKGALIIEDSFANPFGIDVVEFSSHVNPEQTSEPDREKRLASSDAHKKTLLPCDGGRRAWACLLGAATVESLIRGTYPPLLFDLSLTSTQVFH